MLGHRSGTIAPTIGNTCNNINTQFQTTQRLWLKIILSVLIPLMIGVFTITTTLLQDRFATQQREQDTRPLRQQSDYQADNLQKEAVLVTYLNDISNLLMLENDTKISIQIRTKTLTSLRQLDSE
jgi:hypothetical protein